MVVPCSQVKPAFVGTSIVQPHAARLGARPEKIWIANAPTPAATAFDIMISVWVRVGQSWAKSHGQRSGNLSQSNGAKTQSYVLAVLHPQKDPKRYFKKKQAASRVQCNCINLSMASVYRFYPLIINCTEEVLWNTSIPCSRGLCYRPYKGASWTLFSSFLWTFSDRFSPNSAGTCKSFGLFKLAACGESVDICQKVGELWTTTKEKTTYWAITLLKKQANQDLGGNHENNCH